MVHNMLKNYCITYLILFIFFIKSVHNTSTPVWHEYPYPGPFKLKFGGCNKNGWTCTNLPDGEMKIIFSCPKDFEKDKPELKWTFEGLPSSARSLTLQNCDLNLQIEELVLYKLNKLIIKNIAELSMAPRRRELYLKALKENQTEQYNNRVSILRLENIKYIRTLIFGTIWGKFDEVIVRRCKFGTLEWHAFHGIETSLFDFTENEVNTVKARAFNVVKANRINILGNIFHHLEEGSFFAVNTGLNATENIDEDEIEDNENNNTEELPIIQFESNLVNSSDLAGLCFGNPYVYMKTNYTNNMTHTNRSTFYDHNLSIHHNKFNCAQTRWLLKNEVIINDDDKPEVKYAKGNKTRFIKIINDYTDFYIVDYEDNQCSYLDCEMSIGLYKDRFKIYGPKNNICDSTLEYNLKNVGATNNSVSKNILIIFFNLIMFLILKMRNYII